MRRKLLAANLLLLALLSSLAATAGAARVTSAARVLVSAALVAGLGAWAWHRWRGAPGRRRPQARLRLAERLSLSQRAALALVEVDGRALLVVHGEGFASVHPLRRADRAPRAAPPASELLVR